MEGQIEAALGVIKGVCTAVVIGIAGISALIILAKKLPTAEDPVVKKELINSELFVVAALVLTLGIVWGIPFLVSLF